MRLNDEVRVRLSVGAIALAVIHASLQVGVFLVMHPAGCSDPPPAWNVPASHDVPPRGMSIQSDPRPLEQPPVINYSAQSELKQQIRRPCYPCQPTPQVNLPPPTLIRPTPRIITPTPLAPVLVDQPPSILRAPGTFAGVGSTLPPQKPFQLSLFLDNSPQSQRIKQWFDTHHGLKQVCVDCEVQIYTANNALYRSRYAEIVPVTQFPVVLFTDESGGHIHAAGRSMIPGSAEELFQDLKYGYALYRQAKSADVKTGALREAGYSWDEAINPRMQLSEDCPGGDCDSTRWQPGQRVRDLFDGARNTRDAIIWANANEILTAGLVLIGLIAVVVLLTKVGPLRR